MARQKDTLRLDTYVRRLLVPYVKRLSDQIHRDLVFTTQVDTGRAVTNWRVTLNTPINYSTDAYSPGSLGSTEPINIDYSRTAASAQIWRYNLGDTVYIQNTILYVRELIVYYEAVSLVQIVAAAHYRKLRAQARRV